MIRGDFCALSATQNKRAKARDDIECLSKGKSDCTFAAANSSSFVAIRNTFKVIHYLSSRLSTEVKRQQIGCEVREKQKNY